MNIMSNVRKLKASAAPVSVDDEIVALERRRSELDAEDKADAELLIQLEKATASSLAASADHDEAEAFLRGEKFDPRRVRPIPELVAVRARREVRRRALKIAHDRLHKLRETRAEQISASFFSEVAALEKQRVMLAIELQKVNRQRETLREKIAVAGGGPFLMTDGADLLGIGDRIDEVSWAVDRVVADGAVTAAEIERAKAL
jgi:hypothetical protein